MIEQPEPLAQPPQWWVVRTAEGLKVLPYRSNSRTPAIGPFMTPYTAHFKLNELKAKECSRRQLVKTTVVCTAIMVIVTAALMLVQP